VKKEKEKEKEKKNMAKGQFYVYQLFTIMFITTIWWRCEPSTKY
jgi:hypothetical protein